jgi:hypothetical protein
MILHQAELFGQRFAAQASRRPHDPHLEGSFPITGAKTTPDRAEMTSGASIDATYS